MAQAQRDSRILGAAAAAALWRALCQRPLLPLALNAACGCAAGLQSGGEKQLPAPFFAGLVVLLAVALTAGTAAWLARRHGRPDWPGLLTASAALFVLCAALGTWRKTPPPLDAAWLVRAAAVSDGPIQPLRAELYGWVAAAPEYGDYGVEFPFEVTSLSTASENYRPTGRIWCRLPSGVTVNAGDALLFKASLTDLPRSGNPGERELAGRFLSRGCFCLARVYEAKDVRLLGGDVRYPVQRFIAAAGGGISGRYQSYFTANGHAYPHANAQLLAAMVFGEGALREPLPRTLRDAFRTAGLSHVLVASGGQIVLGISLIVGAARLGGLRNGWLLVVLLPLLLGYALLAGGGASIWRAVIAGLCLTAGLLMGRETDGLSLWSLALIAMLLIDPLQLHDIGFQLSFAATWGLIAVAPRIRAGVQALFKPNFIIDAAILSLAAQIATLPILLYHFGQLSFSGLGANLLAVPLTGMLVPAGMAGLLVPPLNALNHTLVNCIQNTAFAAAALPGASVAVMPLGAATAALLYLLIFLLLPPRQWWRDLRTMLAGDLSRFRARFNLGHQQPRSRLGWAVAFVLAGLVIAGLTLPSGRGGRLQVAVLDVGQGESIVIRSPAGLTAIIDGGTSSTERRNDAGRAVIVPYLQSKGVREIQAMFLTHADLDHCNGLRSVVEEVPVRQAIDGAAALQGESFAAEPDYLELRDAWNRRRIPVFAARAGARYPLGGGAFLTVLAPRPPALPGDNDNCAVIRLDYGQTSFLFTGDIEEAAEERLLAEGSNLACTVLKVGHHGSKSSTSDAFLSRARPKLAVISCGRYNDYNHPSPGVLERLARHKVATFRTDRDGAVEFTSDGTQTWVQTAR